MKIELLETSAVGTPAYADAHFSFFKSLSKAYEDLKEMKGGQNLNKMAEQEITPVEVAEIKEAPKVEAVEEVKTEEVKAAEVITEAPVEAKVAETKVEEVKEVVQEVKETETIETKSINDLISTLKEVIAKMPVERALVETNSKEDKLKSMSNGELFMQVFKH